MSLAGLRVGYVPYSRTLTEPGDRRRFCFYAERRGIDFEIADPSQDYDVVLLSASADISAWRHYSAGEAKLIFELIDSYMATPRLDPKSMFRGIAKFAIGQNRSIIVDYRGALEDMLARSDAVVCSTEEQRSTYLDFCPNAHVILDAHTEYGSRCKSEFGIGETLNLVWEGLPYTLDGFSEIAPVLQQLARERPIALHLATDLEFARYARRFMVVRTDQVARQILPGTYLYQWNPHILGSLVTACDIAVIPLDLRDPFARGKPENKLLIFWRLGMPTITSSTPAYQRVMEASGIDLACQTPAEWDSRLRTLIDDEDLRRTTSQRGRSFVEANHNEEQLLGRWDRLFESVLK